MEANTPDTLGGRIARLRKENGDVFDQEWTILDQKKKTKAGCTLHPFLLLKNRKII